MPFAMKKCLVESTNNITIEPQQCIGVCCAFVVSGTYDNICSYRVDFLPPLVLQGDLVIMSSDPLFITHPSNHFYLLRQRFVNFLRKYGLQYLDAVI